MSLVVALIVTFTSLLSSGFVIEAAIVERGSEELGQCYAEETSPYLLMGTRTAYESGRANLTRLPPESDCKPVQIWALIRHGTRYPGSEDISQFLSLRQLRDRIIDNHEKRGKGSLCRADLENLRKWDLDPPANEITADYLTAQGEEEMRLLAKRLRTVYPELLRVDPKNVTQADYKFRATEKQRTQASMDAFMYGLFDKKDIVKPEKTPKNDSLLYTYKNCPAYEESLVSDRVDEETEKFTASPDFRRILENVSERLGFDRVMHNDTLLLMYEMCRYEKAWHSVERLSPWCAVLGADEIRVLEYREDLGCYYYCGPGRRINELVGCPPLQDMIKHFRNLKRGDSDEPKGIFYFSHTVTLQATLAAMGIGKDPTPLTSKNYHEQIGRTFRTSFIGPFAGNIIAVFYRCSDARKSHKVTIHVSENLWRFDDCIDGVCDWEALERRFGVTADSCNLDFCYRTD